MTGPCVVPTDPRKHLTSTRPQSPIFPDAAIPVPNMAHNGRRSGDVVEPVPHSWTMVAIKGWVW